jgi:hypothetical protein
MRSKLISSVVTVTAFWWAVLFFLWGFRSPASNLAGIEWARPVLDVFGYVLPKDAGLFDGIVVQGVTLLIWTVPVLLLAGVAFGVGFRSAWSNQKADYQAGEQVRATVSSVRGVGLTLGVMPGFRHIDKEDLDYSDSRADGLPPEERALLAAVFGVLAAHPDACPGERDASLMEQAEVLAIRELTDGGKHPGLSAIVAVARLVGTAVSFAKDSKGAWEPIKADPARQGELVLAGLPEWWELPPLERTAVGWAVGFWDTPEDMPISPVAVARLATAVLRQAKDLDKAVGVAASQEAVAKTREDTPLIDIFLAKLSGLPFQNGLPKGVQAVGWRKGPKVFLIENQLIEKYILPEIPAGRRKAMQGIERGEKLSNLTLELLAAFKLRGWLVTNEAGFSLAPNLALWKMQAGKITYKRIIALDVGNDPLVMEMLPSDSIYPVALLEPQFAEGAKQVYAPSDLGGLIKSKPTASTSAPASGAAQPSSAPADLGVLIKSKPTAPVSGDPAPAPAPGGTPASVTGSDQPAFTHSDLGGLIRAKPAAPASSAADVAPPPTAGTPPDLKPGPGGVGA